MVDALKRYKIPLVIVVTAFLCWARMLVLKGIWWDDWAWVWHYVSSGDLAGFLGPFKSLRHEPDGYILFLNFRLLNIFHFSATNIWNVSKFVLFAVNPLLVYFIARRVLKEGSILPAAIAVIYAASPVVNNLCLVEYVRRLYLFFFLLSILFSVKSVDKKGFKSLYYIPAVFFGVLSMAGLESFVFFDAARPVLVFYVLFAAFGEKPSRAFPKAVIHWVPFVLAGSMILLNRTGFFEPRTGMYADAYQLKSVASFGQCVAAFVYLFAGQMGYFFKSIFLHAGKYLFVILEAAIAVMLMFAILLKQGERIKDKEEGNEAMPVALFGIFLMVIGLFPYLMVRGAPSFGVASRHALLASVGVSVFIPSFLAALYYKGLVRKTFFYALLGCVLFTGVFQCNAAAIAYRNDWREQMSFWRKFTEMVPDVKEKTFLAIDMPREEWAYLGPWKGSFEFAAPLNLIYAKSGKKAEVDNRFAASAEELANKTLEWSSAKTKDKEEVTFMSFKGPQTFYPKNLMTVSYYDGNMRLGKNDRVEAKKSGTVFPLRWVAGVLEK